MTKAKPKAKRLPGRQLRHQALYAEEAFWVALAAKLSGKSVHAFISGQLREHVRDVLESNNIDPDEAWAKYQAARA